MRQLQAYADLSICLVAVGGFFCAFGSYGLQNCAGAATSRRRALQGGGLGRAQKCRNLRLRNQFQLPRLRTSQHHRVHDAGRLRVGRHHHRLVEQAERAVLLAGIAVVDQDDAVARFIKTFDLRDVGRERLLALDIHGIVVREVVGLGNVVL